MTTKERLKRWDDGMYLRVYELARAGLSDTQIMKATAGQFSVWKSWLAAKPKLGEALAKARARRSKRREKGKLRSTDWSNYDPAYLPKDTETFFEFALDRLPRDLRETWEKLENATTAEMVEDILDGGGVRTRQRLYVYAVVASNFNGMEACRKVNVSPFAVRQWAKTDPFFGDLMRQLEESKKDFVEGGIFDLVARRDPATTRFAARCLIPEKYNPVRKVEHTGEHKHLLVPVEIDQLPVAEKRRYLAALPPRTVEAVEE